MPVDNFPAVPNGVTIRKFADTRRVIRISEIRRSERMIPYDRALLWFVRRARGKPVPLP